MTKVLPVSEFDQRFIGSTPITIIAYYKFGIDSQAILQSFFEIVSIFNILSSKLRKKNRKYYLCFDPDGFTVSEKHFNIEFNFDRDDADRYVNIVSSNECEPLTSLTISHFNNGSILCLSISHLLLDGMGFGLLLYSWGLLLKTGKFRRPSMQRLYSISKDDRGKLLSATIKNSVELEEKFCRNKYMSIWVPRKEIDIEFLTEKTQSDSNFSMLTAMILKKYHSCLVPDRDYITLVIPIDCRGIHDGIDRDFIGNAIHYSISVFKRIDLESWDICSIYESINRKLATIKSRSYINSHVSIDETGSISRVHDEDNVFDGIDLETRVLATTTSRKFGLGSLGKYFGKGEIPQFTSPLTSPIGFSIIVSEDRYLVQFSLPDVQKTHTSPPEEENGSREKTTYDVISFS